MKCKEKTISKVIWVSKVPLDAILSQIDKKIGEGFHYNIDLRKLRVNKITSRRNQKAALNEKPTDSPQSFFIRSSI